MAPRHRKQMAFAAAGLTTACAIAVAVLGAAAPVSVEAPQPVGGVMRPAKVAAAPKPQAVSLAGLQRACAGVSLRRPLVDTVRVTEVHPAVQPESTLSFRLVATATEQGRTTAIFQRPDGTTELAGPGEQFREMGGMVTVKQVDSRKAVVEFGGVLHELKAPTSP